MKRGISISLIFLMLTLMLHLTIATHYCEGKLSSTKVSFTGKLASCGMICSEKELSGTGTEITNHCCDDILSIYAVDCNYLPSFSFVPESFQFSFYNFSITAGYPVYPVIILKSLYTNVSPPGAFMSTNVDLSGICVFRI